MISHGINFLLVPLVGCAAVNLLYISMVCRGGKGLTREGGHFPPWQITVKEQQKNWEARTILLLTRLSICVVHEHSPAQELRRREKKRVHRHKPPRAEGGEGEGGEGQGGEELRDAYHVREERVCGKGDDDRKRAENDARKRREEGKEHRPWDGGEDEEICEERVDGELAILIEKKRQDRKLCRDGRRRDLAQCEFGSDEGEAHCYERREDDEARRRKDGELETGVVDEDERIPHDHAERHDRERAECEVHAPQI